MSFTTVNALYCTGDSTFLVTVVVSNNVAYIFIVTVTICIGAKHPSGNSQVPCYWLLS